VFEWERQITVNKKPIRSDFKRIDGLPDEAIDSDIPPFEAAELSRIDSPRARFAMAVSVQQIG
jgi:hypothetical protein